MNDRQKHFLLLLAASLIAPVGCSKADLQVSEPPTVSGLEVAQVQERQVPKTLNAAGTVHARESATLSAQMMGRVDSVLVREGDQIQSGRLLVVLDGGQALSDLERARASVATSEAEIKGAETEADLAKSTLVRYEVLRDKKSVSPQEFDEVQRRSQSATARLESARSMMLAAKASERSAHTVAGYSRLYAPFSGYVTARHADPGSMAMPGMPLLEVDKAGSLQLQVAIDESLLHLVHRGMTVPVVTAAAPQPVSGKISEIVPAADPTSHSFLVKIDLPGTAGLHPGMFGSASIEKGVQASLLVPPSAVVTHGSLNSLWIVDANHVASLRYITVGTKQEAGLEVLSGLTAGEKIVLSPGDRELGGKKIEVRQ
jgi:RND family efflux transporter MFP subunit